MRVGYNPAKNIDYVKQPNEVTVAILTYIPFLSGYYADTLEVLKVCIQSLLENTEMPFDLMVFDNGSCSEVREYLQEVHAQGKIQYLILSEDNMGISAAWRFMFNALPGKYIAYADSDMYYEPGWLQACLRVIETYPNVGTVTARPMIQDSKYYSAVSDWAENNSNVRVSTGKEVEWDTYWEHAISCGAEEDAAKQWFEDYDTTKLEYMGVQTIGGGGHFQFVGLKSILKQHVSEKSEKPMGHEREFDENLNANGYLRLSTNEVYVRHLGNSLEGLTRTLDKKKTKRKFSGLFEIRLVKKILMYIYTRIFRIYYSVD